MKPSHVVLVLSAMLCLSSTAWADLINYKFTGENLSGTFVLDGETPITITTAGLALARNQRSPRNYLESTWNSIHFEPVPWLQIFDSNYDITNDFGVVRGIGDGVWLN